MVQNANMKTGAVLYASVNWTDSNGQIAVVTDTVWSSSDPAIVTVVAYPMNTLTAALTSVGPSGVVLVKAVATLVAGGNLETAMAITVSSGEPMNGSIAVGTNPPNQTGTMMLTPPM